ncbi:RidA family protein [Pseudomonas sp. PS02288]|uniref:RidA family protein n=1 Tax=Pseudomonas sp. PS02288 TaxID=2991443 RepID=UPI00249B912F|nr:RidA family protein [Pseudomonas sp. PS02288]
MSEQQQDAVVRHLNPAHGVEPWAREFAEAIEIPGGARQLVLSGVGPAIIDASAAPGSVAAYGDTAAQTRSVIEQIAATLQRRGYALGDVISMQALLVGDPTRDGVADFEGFSAVYNRYFGTAEQPRVPTRTRAQVIRLVPPGWLVEITAIAVKG